MTDETNDKLREFARMIVVRPEDRIGIYVDGANADHSLREESMQMDWMRLREWFMEIGPVTVASYYGADTGTQGQFRFFDLLGHQGWRLVKKVAVNRQDADGTVRKSATWT